MKRHTAVSGVRGVLTLIAPLTIALLAAQAPPAPLEFESVSVKVHPMTPGTYLLKDYPHAPPFVIPTGPRFTDTAHVQDLVMQAYGLTEFQMLYLPGWALSRDGFVYDIDAKAKGNAAPTPAQLQQMLQALLADRFQLKVHWETKPKFSLYALVPDKNGPKFKPFHRDEPAAAQTGQRPFAGTTLFTLARFLSQNLDGPVVDRTGLPAIPYDFDIDKLVDLHEVDREEGSDPLSAQDYLRTAVQHQLGLRLDSRKESMQILIVDHVAEPVPN